MGLVRRVFMSASRMVALAALMGSVAIVAFGSAAIGPPAAPARAATAFVQNLGQGSTFASPLSLITTASVTAGDSIVLAVATEDNGTMPQCSDPVNGVYTVDSQNTADVRVVICAKHNAQALPAGSTITVTGLTATGIYAVAMQFTGLAPIPVDRTADTGATLIFSGAGTMGPVAATSQANEVLVAAFFYSPGPDFLTPGTNGTANNCAETGTSTYTTAPTEGTTFTSKMTPMYCTVSAQAAYSASATTMNFLHNGAFVTYKLAAPPTVTTTGSALNYTTGGTPAAIDPGVTVADPESTDLSGATVSITGGFSAAVDSLGFTNQSGITGSYNAATGVLTLTGTATLAQYQAALRSVTYTNNAATTSLATRTVSFQVTDNTALTSNVATRQITIPTPTATLTPTTTGTPAPTGTATATLATTATPTATATQVPVKPQTDDTDKSRSLTEDERRERDKTNKSGQHDVHTEGQVVQVERAPDSSFLLVTIALGPGGSERIVIQVHCENGQCPDVREKDEVYADGYQHGVGDPNNYFVATDGFEVTRDGQKVK